MNEWGEEAIELVEEHLGIEKGQCLLDGAIKCPMTCQFRFF